MSQHLFTVSRCKLVLLKLICVSFLCVFLFFSRPSHFRLSLLVYCLSHLTGRPEGSRTRITFRYRLNFSYREKHSAGHTSDSCDFCIFIYSLRVFFFFFHRLHLIVLNIIVVCVSDSLSLWFCGLKTLIFQSLLFVFFCFSWFLCFVWYWVHAV